MTMRAHNPKNAKTCLLQIIPSFLFFCEMNSIVQDSVMQICESVKSLSFKLCLFNTIATRNLSIVGTVSSYWQMEGKTLKWKPCKLNTSSQIILAALKRTIVSFS